jgi:hypothetical protein
LIRCYSFLVRGLLFDFVEVAVATWSGGKVVCPRAAYLFKNGLLLLGAQSMEDLELLSSRRILR